MRKKRERERKERFSDSSDRSKVIFEDKLVPSENSHLKGVASLTSCLINRWQALFAETMPALSRPN